ncbi:GNAT family N-acetyltransferase [Nocardioides sp.]|uniref:GNAT family N-acetyltransferase n=1 Tax=Nocardioides sp. TaxID=35761 RepID=UPI0035691C18
MARVQTSKDTQTQRYEARIDGDLAGFAEYELSGDVIVFTHTEVSDAYEGEGVGSTIARFALDDARSEGFLVVPQCDFIRGWIDKHPEYADLVAED